jgi:two-component system invasion response regulator UvrY
MTVLTVMLIDDHLLVRSGFKSLLSTFEDVCVIAQASCGEDAMDLSKRHQPDVIISEIDLPGMGGLETMKRLLIKNPNAKIIALTAHEEIIYLKRTLDLGVLGYLSKKSAHSVLHDAVKTVVQKKRFIDPYLSQKLLIDELDGNIDPLKELSTREFGVFLQLSKGLALPKIAERLSLSESTISTHLSNIKQKLHVNSHSELILIARRLGLTNPTE